MPGLLLLLLLLLLVELYLQRWMAKEVQFQRLRLLQKPN